MVRMRSIYNTLDGIKIKRTSKIKGLKSMTTAVYLLLGLSTLFRYPGLYVSGRSYIQIQGSISNLAFSLRLYRFVY